MHPIALEAESLLFLCVSFLQKWNAQLVIPASSTNPNNLEEDKEKNQCEFVQYKCVFSSGAAADIPSAPTKYPLSRGEFQEGLGECFGRSKDIPLCPVYM